ncbi:MAG TPA: glycoside hydrolase family 3 C-terminal domain-containing protein, partial [Gemmatimonadaceae bacterium]|nr:glycoside hydrolase family 3 C-terminal domain-containing protein [Gemmatimonadaceae bacterium]
MPSLRTLLCRRTALTIAALLAGHAIAASAQTSKVDQLLRAMTLDEKLGMVHGIRDPQSLGEAGYLPGVPRLGIPPLRLTDGPAGIRITARTTAMPAPIALAATFDTSLAFAYGRVTGLEGRARDQDVQLAPMVNIVRVPNAGRNFETLGEDPLLAGMIVASEIRGIQSQGLIATVKHFAANNQENARQSVSANVDERTLHEIYLPGFEAAVKAGVGAVMCSYNRVNTVYACENPALLTDVLRTQFGFTGWVVSDWGATHSTSAALTAGLDVEMPSGAHFGDSLAAALKAGTVPTTALDGAVRRVLLSMEQAGLLTSTPAPRPTIDTLADAAVAREIAIAGAVLLRNERNALPIRREDLQSLVVVGPGANVPPTSGGGSAHVVGFHTESLLSALERRAGASAKITYVSGVDADGSVVPASAFTAASTTPGDRRGLARVPAGAASAQAAIDPQIDFMGSNALPRGTSWTWTGTVTAPAPGDYGLIVQVGGGRAMLQIDSGNGRGGAGRGRGGAGGGRGGGRGAAAVPGGITTTTQMVRFAPGQSHQIMLTGTAADSTTPLQIRLSWTTPASRQAKFDEAVAAARAARVAIVVGTNEGSEGSDRPTIALAPLEDSLISAVTAANRRTAVVLFAGAPVVMPWAAGAGAILDMWFPGQEGADATAAVLLGEANPSGKLPESFPRQAADAPTNTPERYPGVSGQEAYSEGILVGYRWYDARKIEPLFPFGYGLSYTTFGYSKPSVEAPSAKGPAASGGAPAFYTVRFTVKNTGSVDGAEVAEVYLGPPPAAPVAMAPRQLVGFARVSLKPGESKEVAVRVSARDLSYWSVETHAWV